MPKLVKMDIFEESYYDFDQITERYSPEFCQILKNGLSFEMEKRPKIEELYEKCRERYEKLPKMVEIDQFKIQNTHKNNR